MKYDLGIIGGGPGGYVAAIKGAQSGLKTVLIEKSSVGGVCLNRGCIPTKAMAASSTAMRALKRAESLGVEVVPGARVSLEKIVERKNGIVKNLVKGIEQLLKSNGIDVVRGTASLNANNVIDADGNKYEAENIIIATGSGWKEIPSIKIDRKTILTSDEMLDMKEVPSHLIIIGGGVIGCEFASIFSAFGSKITIIEAMDNVLPMEDKITSNTLARIFKKNGIEVITSKTVSNIEVQNGAKITLSDGTVLEGDKVLVSIGRRPVLDGIDINKLGLKTDNGSIITDDHLRTNLKNIFAVGDVNGKWMLAHVASEEGIVAVDNILGNNRKMNYNAVPRPVYTSPEICCTGMTASMLDSAGISYETGRFGFAASPKAICDSETEGQAIVYAEKSGGKILGAQILGNHATEIAAEITMAIENNLNINDVSKTIHSHPTLSESVKEAAEDCNKKSIHKVYR